MIQLKNQHLLFQRNRKSPKRPLISKESPAVFKVRVTAVLSEACCDSLQPFLCMTETVAWRAVVLWTHAVSFNVIFNIYFI